MAKKKKEVEKELEDVQEDAQVDVQENSEGNDQSPEVEKPQEPKKPKVEASNHPIVQKAMRRIGDLPDKSYDLFEVIFDPAIRINGEWIEGKHVIPRHLMETIQHMIYSKRKADLEIFTGKNYLVEKLADRTLIKEIKG